jgi:hypothetical protein
MRGKPTLRVRSGMRKLERLWRRLRGRIAAVGAPGRFLCDSCRYDYRGACKRPERPNATACEDYRRR